MVKIMFKLGIYILLFNFSICFGQDLTTCSFNIQFLGNSKTRENSHLAKFIKKCDIVVLQELVAPPYPLIFPDNTPVKPDLEAREFFREMQWLGYSYWLSEEDTGTGDDNHLNSSSTEWWVTFYKGSQVIPAFDLPHGFLSSDRTNHPDWERVPYAFSFRNITSTFDFVLISVHLQPGSGSSNRSRRKHELDSILDWVDKNQDKEKDFIILGDMNFYTLEEIKDSTPLGFVSLNLIPLNTNTNVNSPQPYDHVMARIEYSKREIDFSSFMVLDLVKAMSNFCEEVPYPGNPYNHNRFRALYSDHSPVIFEMTDVMYDDD